MSHSWLWYRVFANGVLDRKPDRVTGYKVLIDLTSLIFTNNIKGKVAVLKKYKSFRFENIWIQHILNSSEKVQLGSMPLLFSSFLFIISKFYISTIIVKIQLNDKKIKNINLLFTKLKYWTIKSVFELNFER
jgi:hypothetical protein